MKFPRLLPCLLAFLFVLPSASLPARTPNEISNMLKSEIIPSYKAEKISITHALEQIGDMAGLKKKKIALSIAAPMKTDRTYVAVDYSNSSAYTIIQELAGYAGLKVTFKKDQILIY